MRTRAISDSSTGMRVGKSENTVPKSRWLSAEKNRGSSRPRSPSLLRQRAYTRLGGSSPYQTTLLYSNRSRGRSRTLVGSPGLAARELLRRGHRRNSVPELGSQQELLEVRSMFLASLRPQVEDHDGPVKKAVAAGAVGGTKFGGDRKISRRGNLVVGECRKWREKTVNCGRVPCFSRVSSFASCIRAVI